MMAHSVTQGHLRHQWFSMNKVDHFESLHKKIWKALATPSENRKTEVHVSALLE